jgi:adenylate kinase
VADDELVERVTGRRLNTETGEIYHLTFKPPPAGVERRLLQRSDDTEETRDLPPARQAVS